MDLKLYFQKIRETEAKITDPFPILVSKETEDGGKGRQVHRSDATRGGEDGD